MRQIVAKDVVAEEVSDVGRRRLQPIQGRFHVPAFGQDGLSDAVLDGSKSEDPGGFRIDFQINR
ncbi:hypothetical protein [Paracoccus benzoatiresistens]|uniref:Uncharacterized protein n=1 Tax=Paracoccus benzoatiresistens TaxID=2997341 RepID=A0ABT4JBH8_9RHOB|nr:hypothetical protein [Paracoccus sp. EF6]MCZ0964456.1 hypothetical protein [Paracoccus sp. EF6]